MIEFSGPFSGPMIKNPIGRVHGQGFIGSDPAILEKLDGRFIIVVALFVPVSIVVIRVDFSNRWSAGAAGRRALVARRLHANRVRCPGLDRIAADFRLAVHQARMFGLSVMQAEREVRTSLIGNVQLKNRRFCASGVSRASKHQSGNRDGRDRSYLHILLQIRDQIPQRFGHERGEENCPM